MQTLLSLSDNSPSFLLLKEYIFCFCDICHNGCGFWSPFTSVLRREMIVNCRFSYANLLMSGQITIRDLATQHPTSRIHVCELQAVRGSSTSTGERDSSRKIVKTNLLGRVRQKGTSTGVIFFELVVFIFFCYQRKGKSRKRTFCVYSRYPSRSRTSSISSPCIRAISRTVRASPVRSP
jgi:hypothetical protein